MLTLDEINFNYDVVEKGPPIRLKNEPVSGTMIVNNKVIGVTNCPRLINFQYDRSKAIFTFKYRCDRMREAKKKK
ncbi:hypothetical protein EBU95_21360 [bacterium]|nr:hypothetical protein [bacterium]